MKKAIIIGVGPLEGLGAKLARRFAAEGFAAPLVMTGEAFRFLASDQAAASRTCSCLSWSKSWASVPTARSAPAHKRVVLTLREWGIRIDEALFLGGRAKGEFLKAFGADIFFDDQQVHIDSAKGHVAAAHVPNGIVNALE